MTTTATATATQLQTVLHRYWFPSAAHPGYKAMVRKIEANAEGRGHWMNAWGGKHEAHPAEIGETSEPVTLELAHIFNNQWNEASRADDNGRRLFDWYEKYTELKEKAGHWLEITPAMAQARAETLKCRYCGHQYGPHHGPTPEPVAPGLLVCTRCLDSEYLKPTDFPLLRLVPVAGESFKDIPMSDEERAAIMPHYVSRQTTGTNSRAKQKRDQQRAGVLKDFEKATRAAMTERDGMLWLWDHGVNLDNVIYYAHTDKFCFGWRSPLAAEVRSALLDIISEFPHEYEIK